MATATLANVHRVPALRPEPYQADDFIHWRSAGASEEEKEPELLADPVAQSNLMRAAMFGRAPT